MSNNHTRGAARSWRVLMIGSDTRRDGLRNVELRFQELVDELPEIRGLLVGGGNDPRNERIRPVATPDWPLPLRLLAITWMIRGEARLADIIDIHSARHAFVPLILGVFRGRKVVVHVDAQRRARMEPGWSARAARSRLRFAAERYVYRRATIAIAPTGASKRVLVEDFRVSPWRVKVLSRGVPAEYGEGDRDAARRDLSLPAGGFTVCCVRPLVSRLGIRIMLDAWSRFVAEDVGRGRQPPPRLLIGGHDGIADTFAEELALSGLSDSVTVLPRLSTDHVARVYRAADLQVVPSQPVEGRGPTVLEAAACGTPSIVALTRGLADALADLDETLLVTPNDPAALARRIGAAAGGHLPGRGATRQWARWHTADLATQHRAIYDDLVAESPAQPRKLRVAYIGHVAQLSGGEIALARLIDALPEVEAHVILAEDGPLVARLLASGTSVEVLPMRERTRQLRKDRVNPRGLPVAAVAGAALYTLRLAHRLRAIKADVVHANTLKAGICGCLAARLASVPSVWHVRDRIAPDYLPRMAVLLLRRLISTLPDGVIANSEATRATLPTLPERTRVVHSIVHDPVTAPRPRARAPERPSLAIGMLGRLAPWKGQDVFLRSFARAFGDRDALAIVVGSAMFGAAETRYESELHELAASLGIADRVEFRGFREDVWSELADLDVLVHASITPEPFGQVIVEAMLAGVPVIAAAGGGPSEIVTDGIDGLLYPAGDVEALCAALTRLAGDPDLRERLSGNARERVAAFSPQAAADGVMSIYTAIMQSERASGQAAGRGDAR